MDLIKRLTIKRKNFKRYGTTYQFKINDSTRLKNVLELDEVFWVAINAPIATLNLDSDFLIYVDDDNDDNIRPSEIKRTIRWLLEHLLDVEDIKPKNCLLNINKINRNAKQGEEIYQAASEVLLLNSCPNETKVSLDQVRDIINKDKDSKNLKGFHLVEKLILFQANIITLLNSYVSFPDLYNPKANALFEMGTLIMDGRRFTLSVMVPDIERHVQFCELSKMFVLYVKVSEKKGKELFDIAVPVTSGMRGNLKVNKLGIFIDIYRKEYFAKVIKIVENPISFAEALMSPFSRLGTAMASKIDEISSNAEEKLEELSSRTISSIGVSSSKKGKKTIIAGQTSGGMLAGGAVAVAALSSSVAFITKILSSLTISSIISGLGFVFIAILLPTAIIAYIKLSKRDLSAILEGSGWGINTRMKLTYRQAKTFTKKPVFSGKKLMSRLST